MDGIDHLLSTNGFMPHGVCYLWQPSILALHIASDSLIALAYFSIPFTLFYFVRRRTDLRFNWIFICFAIFIVACGTTHLMEIWVIWHPAHWLSGGIKAITAFASVPTAILLAKLVPTALRLPNTATLQATYAALKKEVADHTRTEAELRLASEALRSEAARGQLAAIVESCDDAIISITLLGIITSWNRGAEKMFGYTAGEAIGIPATLLYPPDRLAEETEILASMNRDQRIPSFETVRVHKGGTPIAAEPFNVVITDLGMPHVDGRTVAGAIKSSQPDIPVILLTGWGHRLLADNVLPPHVDRVLSKPPKLAALRVALAEVTSRAST